MRRTWLPIGIIALLAWGGLLAALSVARYTGYNTGMLDFGNMTQAISDGARGGALRFTQAHGQTSRLAGHAEVIYLGLATLFRWWPDPRMLLAAQALLVTSAAWPAYRLGRRLGLSSTAAVLASAALLLQPTAVAAVLFDLHGDTLAMPCVIWLLAALAERRWAAALAWAALSLLCKIYVVAPIGLLALTLLHPHTAPFGLSDAASRRFGLLLGGLAAAWGGFVVLGLHRWFGSALGAAQPGYLAFYFANIGQIGWAGWLERAINLLAVLLPTALLWRRAPWTAAPAAAIMLPAAITTGPGAAYAYSYHHYALAVPFLIAGTLEGISRQSSAVAERRRPRRQAELAGLWLLTALLLHIGLSSTPLSIAFWRGAPGDGLDASGFGQTARDRLKDRWLQSTVAPAAPVAASNFLAPHVAQRAVLSLVRYPDEPPVATPALLQRFAELDAVYADVLFDYLAVAGSGYAGGVDYDYAVVGALLQQPGWSVVGAEDGLVALAQHAPATAILTQTLRAVSASAAPLATFGDQVALLSSRLEPLGGARWRATVRWQALRDLAPTTGLAVSQLAGVAQSRTVHLPITLLRTADWRAGTVLEEQFDVAAPAGLAPGSYRWQVGWYDREQPFAASTDARSQIGATIELGTITIP